MTKARIAVLSLLLATPAAFAEQVTINWSGDIFDYAATPDSHAPQSLSNDDIWGKITFDTSLFPPADLGNPPGVSSYSGTDLFQSSFHWQGGLFKTGLQSDLVLYDAGANEFQLTAQDTYTDRHGASHTSIFTFDLLGYGTSSVGGGGNFINFTDSGTGYAGQYSLDKVRVKTTAAPEIDPGSGLTALSFLAGCLAVIRGRRRAA
jgi:hypothetical protein